MTDSYHPTVDGVVTIIDTFKASLESLGHKVFIVAPDPGEDNRIEGVRYFPAVAFTSYEGYFVPILPSNKLEVLKEIRPDVIHTFGAALMPLKGLIAARALRVPAMLTMTTMVTDTLGYYSPLKNVPAELQEKVAWVYLRWLMNSMDGVMVHTRCIMDELEAHGVRPKDGRIIPAGINTDVFKPTVGPFDIRDTHNIRGKKVLMHVGRISYEKHVDDIVRAMARINDSVLVVVGDGPAIQSVKDAAEECGVSDRVVFTGFIDRVILPEIYSVADVCISCSRFETQGLSIMEAMACGRPVVCPNARAFSEIITDGVDGFLFDGGVDELTARIQDALADDGTVAQRGMETAASYSEENCAKMLLSMYEDLIDRKNEELGKER